MEVTEEGMGAMGKHKLCFKKMIRFKNIASKFFELLAKILKLKIIFAVLIFFKLY